MTIPKFFSDVLAHPGWYQAMIDELNGTWELVPLSYGKSVVGCRWAPSNSLASLHFDSLLLRFLAFHLL